MTQKYSLAEVFRLAENIESNGHEFYTQAARAVQDPAVQRVFGDLAEKELAHRRLFADWRDQYCTREQMHWVDPDGQAAAYLEAMAENHVFNLRREVGHLLASVQTPLSALRLAIGFEKDTIAYFTALKGGVPPVLQEKVDLLIREELDHIRQLQDAIAALPS